MTFCVDNLLQFCVKVLISFSSRISNIFEVFIFAFPNQQIEIPAWTQYSVPRTPWAKGVVSTIDPHPWPRGCGGERMVSTLGPRGGGGPLKHLFLQFFQEPEHKCPQPEHKCLQCVKILCRASGPVRRFSQSMRTKTFNALKQTL